MKGKTKENKTMEEQNYEFMFIKTTHMTDHMQNSS